MALQLDPMPQIWGITGNLGGGKSLTAVNLAVNSMRRGFFVVSNITLNVDRICQAYGERCRGLYQHFSFEDEDFDPFKLPCGSPRGSGGNKRVLVIMDECAEWVDQYSSAKDPRIQRFWSWLRHSSKRSQDVILIVQRLEYLNKVLRLLISKWVIVDDLRVFRLPFVKMRIPMMGGFVMQRVFDRTKRLVQGPALVAKAEWGRFYDTAECLNTTGASYNAVYGLEAQQPSLAGLLWLVAVAVVLLAVSVGLVSSRARGPAGPRLRGGGDAPRGALPCLGYGLMGHGAQDAIIARPSKRTDPQRGGERVAAPGKGGL